MLVTITEFTINPPLQVASDNLVLRCWYSNDFIAGDNVTPVQGGNGQEGFYYTIPCTRDLSSNLVVPDFQIQATTESSPTATFQARLYIDEAP